jgi:amidase
VESVITGFGSYDWQQTHTPATQTAVTISLLVNAGAVCTGKQSMDEFGLRCQILVVGFRVSSAFLVK